MISKIILSSLFSSAYITLGTENRRENDAQTTNEKRAMPATCTELHFQNIAWQT